MNSDFMNGFCLGVLVGSILFISLWFLHVSLVRDIRKIIEGAFDKEKEGGEQ